MFHVAIPLLKCASYSSQADHYYCIFNIIDLSHNCNNSWGLGPELIILILVTWIQGSVGELTFDKLVGEGKVLQGTATAQETPRQRFKVELSFRVHMQVPGVGYYLKVPQQAPLRTPRDWKFTCTVLSLIASDLASRRQPFISRGRRPQTSCPLGWPHLEAS